MGLNEFEFMLNEEFLTEFEYSPIEYCKVEVDLKLFKTESMFDLKFDFINRGFKVYISAKNNQLVIYKNDMVSDGLIINDNGGEFNIDKYGYNISVGSVNYVIGDDMKPVSPSMIAGMIENIYNNERGEKTREEAPATTGTKSKEDISKAIKGLQYLADKGNEKAIKAIKGLQYLLNK